MSESFTPLNINRDNINLKKKKFNDYYDLFFLFSIYVALVLNIILINKIQQYQNVTNKIITTICALGLAIMPFAISLIRYKKEEKERKQKNQTEIEKIKSKLQKLIQIFNENSNETKITVPSDDEILENIDHILKIIQIEDKNNNLFSLDKLEYLVSLDEPNNTSNYQYPKKDIISIFNKMIILNKSIDSKENFEEINFVNLIKHIDHYKIKKTKKDQPYFVFVLEHKFYKFYYNQDFDIRNKIKLQIELNLNSENQHIVVYNENNNIATNNDDVQKVKTNLIEFIKENKKTLTDIANKLIEFERIKIDENYFTTEKTIEKIINYALQECQKAPQNMKNSPCKPQDLKEFFLHVTSPINHILYYIMKSQIEKLDHKEFNVENQIMDRKPYSLEHIYKISDLTNIQINEPETKIETGYVNEVNTQNNKMT